MAISTSVRTGPGGPAKGAAGGPGAATVGGAVPGLDALVWDDPVELAPVADPVELEYWSLVADLAARYQVRDGDGDGDDWGPPRGWAGQELAEGLTDATRGLERATLDRDETVQVFDAGLVEALGALRELRARGDALVVSLALEAAERGLHSARGVSLVDWLVARCPGTSTQEATWVDQVVKCARRASGGPLREAVVAGQVPLHRAAMVARALNRIAPAVNDVDKHEGYVAILAGAAADLAGMPDRDLGLACQKTVRDVLDDEDDKEKTAHQLRSVTRRSVGDGLTQFTVYAPDEAAAVLDGIITGELAAPAHGTDENGDLVADVRMPCQRKFDALMTVVDRGLGNPGAPPSTGRATVIVTIPFDPERGRPAGTGITPGGLLVGPIAAGKLACSGEITPVWVGPGDEPLALGRTARYASPAQWKALVVRDRHCTYPGCTRLPQWCDTHHLDWWHRDHGRTDLHRLALLCEPHHHLVHQEDLHAQVVGGVVIWHL